MTETSGSLKTVHALIQAERLLAAEKLLGVILRAAPTVPGGYRLRAELHRRRAEPVGAVRCLRRCLALAPGQGPVYLELGQIFHELGRPAGLAAASFHAVSLLPNQVRVWVSLVTALTQLRRWPASLHLMRRILALAPSGEALFGKAGYGKAGYGKAGSGLTGWQLAADVARWAGRGEVARRWLESATLVRPQAASPWLTMGQWARDDGDIRRAVMALTEAGQRQPSLFEAWALLGTIRIRQRSIPEALALGRRAAACRPQAPGPLVTLGAAWAELGETDRALVAFDAALLRQSDHEAALRNRALVLMLSSTAGPRELQQAAAAACQQLLSTGQMPRMEMESEPKEKTKPRPEPEGTTGVAAPPSSQASAPSLAPERRLRVGIMAGAGFCRHTHSCLLLPLVEAHDPSVLELHLYSELAPHREDDISRRYQETSAHWHRCAGLSDPAFFRYVREQALDIMIDHVGLTDGGRPRALAWRMAPLQINLLLMGTTGVATMDVLLADRHLLPPDDQVWYGEQVEYLTSAYLYAPIWPSPAVTPRSAAGPILFGSANVLSKLSPATVALWSRLLAALPDARLILKARPLSQDGIRAQVLSRFARHGVAPERLELRGWTAAPGGHFDFYADIDIALDPVPYTGGTTTREALWMGVPVVSVAGRTMVGRYGASLLRTLGLNDWVAADDDAYISTAVTRAGDRRALAQLRLGLRERLRHSRLMDGAAYARELEEVLRRLWRDRCQGR